MIDDLRKETQGLTSQLIAWRRDFHRYPETAFEEHRTSAVLKKFLEEHGIPVQVMAKTGLRGVLQGQAGGKTVALRADIDALPLKEEGDKEYISENPGATHACGHDGHMAILLGFAQWIAAHREELDRDVVLLFQPAEESIGGAKPMIEEGALSDPEAAAVFGFHLFPDLPLGKVGFCAGPMMAQTCEFDIEIRGKSAHGALPHQGVDAVSAAAAVIAGLQQIVSRRVDPYRSAVITIGKLNAGERRNILAARALLEGTLRTFDPEIYRDIREYIDSLLHGVGQSYGVKCTFTEEVVYPAVTNPPGLVQGVSGLLGESYQEIEPLTIAEDFSYYQHEAPGLFMMLGCGAGQSGQVYPLHSSHFDFDEKALSMGLETYAKLLENMDTILDGVGTAY